MAGIPPAHSNNVGGGGGGLDGDRAGMSSPRLVDSELSAPGRIRTSDQQLRRLLLYPPELRARSCAAPISTRRRATPPTVPNLSSPVPLRRSTSFKSHISPRAAFATATRRRPPRRAAAARAGRYRVRSPHPIP